MFADLYYEFNNYLPDFVFPQQSNLKCAVLADVYTAADKTNYGGQQFYPVPALLTYIQDSSKYAALFVDTPASPRHELATGGANDAPGVSPDCESALTNVLT